MTSFSVSRGVSISEETQVSMRGPVPSVLDGACWWATCSELDMGRVVLSPRRRLLTAAGGAAFESASPPPLGAVVRDLGARDLLEPAVFLDGVAHELRGVAVELVEVCPVGRD